jgi:bis(5'-nucleosyl)-tetraphosphatase (symmetrical)
VLGNHDLHLVCVAEGIERRKKRDTLDDVLAAPDRDELVAWLRRQPLMHVEDGWVLVHAGLLPQWSVARARELAGEVEAELRGADYRALLAKMYGDEPRAWNDALRGTDRLRVVINAMTRLRVCDDTGAMVLAFKGEPGDASDGWTPWFDVPGRASADHAVVCGHWSALGLKLRDDLLALDSGCVWGRALTAVRLEDRAVYSVPCPATQGRED